MNKIIKKMKNALDVIINNVYYLIINVITGGKPMSKAQKSDLDERINAARLAGAHEMRSFAKFKNYILELGLARYEKVILPIEIMDSYPNQRLVQTSVRIIQFPGGKV